MNVKKLTVALTALACVGVIDDAPAGSLRFANPLPMDYQFIDIAELPPKFGQGEFSLEVWIKPDASYPIGSTLRGTYGQLKNWSDEDPQPYSSDSWWFSGNWLLDGFTRPNGFSSGDTREGSFSLQFYGGGRLRWLFADSGSDMPKGMAYAVEAWPATSTKSLLDDHWHHVAAVRRWHEPSGASLELWIDGAMVAQTQIPKRINMREYWDQFPHPRNPRNIGGWSIGSEVMTAWNYFFTQYESYKGLVGDMRLWSGALSPKEIADLARGKRPCAAPPLLAWFQFDEGSGDIIHDKIDRTFVGRIHRLRPDAWSSESPPTANAQEH